MQQEVPLFFFVLVSRAKGIFKSCGSFDQGASSMSGCQTVALEGLKDEPSKVQQCDPGAHFFIPFQTRPENTPAACIRFAKKNPTSCAFHQRRF